VVDGLEKQLGDQARVIRLDITQPVGKEAATRYGVIVVPTFVLLDSRGSVIQQYEGFPPREQIRKQVQALFV